MGINFGDGGFGNQTCGVETCAHSQDLWETGNLRGRNIAPGIFPDCGPVHCFFPAVAGSLPGALPSRRYDSGFYSAGSDEISELIQHAVGFSQRVPLSMRRKRTEMMRKLWTKN
jgi:hypothetical protein